MTEPAEIAKALAARHTAEIQMHGTIDPETWWEHRCCTAQLEYAWDIFKVGLGADTLSARAVMRYADIVGVAK